MQRNMVGVQSLNVVLGLVTLALAACIIIVPFLDFDRYYNVVGTFSLKSLSLLQDSALLSALSNSVILSIIASLFAVVCGSVVTGVLQRRSFLLLGALLAVYSINPVARALSYFSLFQVYTPIYDISSSIFGTRFSTSLLLPALILGMHYLPIYLMRSLFVLPSRHDAMPQYASWHKLLFVTVPPWIKGFPISFALFFLLTFFDYWVIQVISGNTVLYWTPLFVQKAVQSRAINEAALMIGVGLLVTVGAYIIAVLFREIVRLLLRFLRPLRFPKTNPLALVGKVGGKIVGTIVVIFLLWPLINMVLRLGEILIAGHSFALTPGAARAIIVMGVIGLAVAVISTIGGLVISALFQTHQTRYRWWLPSLYVLALVPEAAYVLWSLLMTGSGILKGNPWWLLFLMLSFSIPISFFLWESLWGETEERKLWLLGAAMKNDMGRNIQVALTEWAKPAGIIFLVILWLTIDNVFITDFAAGPKWKTLSAVIFDATKRGFSEAEFITSAVGALCVFGFFAIALFLGQMRKEKK